MSSSPSLLAILLMFYVKLEMGEETQVQRGMPWASTQTGDNDNYFKKLYTGRRLKSKFTTSVTCKRVLQCLSHCSGLANCVGVDVRKRGDGDVECGLSDSIGWPIYPNVTEDSSGYSIYSRVCPQMYSHLMSSCYGLIARKMTHPEAELVCGRHGGHLLELEKYKEREMIKSWIQDMGLGGLTNDIWSSGKDVSTSHLKTDFIWFPTSRAIPNSDFIHGVPMHGAMNGSACFMWRLSESKGHDANCTFKQEFICEIDLN